MVGLGSPLGDVVMGFAAFACRCDVLCACKGWPVEENVNMIELVGERNILEKGEHEKEDEMREEEV